MKKLVKDCLNCKNSMCSKHCPVNTEIAKIISLVKENNLKEALLALYYNNPLANITCRVCPYEKNCYGNCILNKKNKAVPFYQLEQELTKKYNNENIILNNNKKALIIGAGPAGISCAIYLRYKGYSVTIYEKNNYLGGLLVDGIPNYRLDFKYILELENYLNSIDVDIILNKEISDIELERLKFEYDFIFKACGLKETRKLGLLDSKYILDAAKIIKSYNLEDKFKIISDYNLKGEVIVLGLGNVAVDAASLLTLRGVKTSICYRRSINEAPCTKSELNELLTHNIEVHYLENPVKVEEENDKLKVTFELMKLGDIDSSGRRGIIGTNNFITRSCNYLVCALGYLNDSFIKTIYNKNINYYKLDNIYYIGDLYNGASTVVNAINSAKKAVFELE